MDMSLTSTVPVNVDVETPSSFEFKPLTSSLGATSSARSFGKQFALATGSARRSSASASGNDEDDDDAALLAVALDDFANVGIGTKKNLLKDSRPSFSERSRAAAAAMNIFNNLGLTQGATIQLDLAPPADGTPRQRVAVRPRASSSSSSSASGSAIEPELLPLYSNGDPIAGEIRVTPPPGKRLEHAGIKVRLIGRVELPSDRGGKHEFASLVRDLCPPGELGAPATFRFDFGRVELPYESYAGGGAARLSYAVRASVKRPYGGSTAREWGLAVRNARERAPADDDGSAAASNGETVANSGVLPSAIPHQQQPIKMEVGIEDCLHIEFEYDKSTYHLSDVVRGRISFLLVRIRLKHMELEVRRRETSGFVGGVGGGGGAKSEATTLAKYEIMDGAPVRGESVPIRLCLAPYDLTPTYLNVHNKFSVRYFLNLVLVDEEDRRYFKQQEITLWRKKGADERACRGGDDEPGPLVGGVIGSGGGGNAAPAATAASAAAAAAPAGTAPSSSQPRSQPPPPPATPVPQLQREAEEEEKAATATTTQGGEAEAPATEANEAEAEAAAAGPLMEDESGRDAATAATATATEEAEAEPLPWTPPAA